MQRFVGEFTAPIEIEIMKTARLNGPGAVIVGADVLGVQGEVVGLPPRAPWQAIAAGIWAVGAVASIVTQLTPMIMPPVTLVALGLFAWGVYESGRRVRGDWRIPWNRVERVLHYPANDRLMAVILNGPVHEQLPESLFFAPDEGVEAVLVAIEAAAPGVEIERQALLAKRAAPVDDSNWERETRPH